MVSNADQESTMVLKIERFQPEGMNIRMSSGKPSYSHVVTVSGSGKSMRSRRRPAGSRNSFTPSVMPLWPAAGCGR